MSRSYKPLDNRSKALVEKRLAAYSAAAAGVAMVALAPAVGAQIVYNDVDPDVVVVGTTYEIDFDGDARTDVTINVDNPGGGFYRVQAIANEDFNGGLVGYGPVVTNYNYFYASVVASGSAISSGNTVQNTNSGRDDFVLTSTFGGLTYGLWQPTVDGYLGVKFEAGGGTIHYAWVRMDVPDALSATVKDWAFESSADTPIDAGAMGVAIEPGPDGMPGTHNLSAIYPNPFNPQAQFSLEIAEQQDVNIAVFDALGRQVASLHNGTLSAGTIHEFQIDGANLPSGVYVVRALGEQFTDIRQVTLTK